MEYSTQINSGLGDTDKTNIDLPELTDLSEIEGIEINDISLDTISNSQPIPTLPTTSPTQINSSIDNNLPSDLLNLELDNFGGIGALNLLEDLNIELNSDLTGTTDDAKYVTTQVGVENDIFQSNDFNDIDFEEVDKEISVSMLQLCKYTDESELVSGSEIFIPIIKKGMEDIVNYVCNDVSTEDIEIKENEFYVLPNCKPIKNVKFLSELMGGSIVYKSTTEKIETVTIMASKLKSILEDKKIEREFFNMLLIN